MTKLTEWLSAFMVLAGAWLMYMDKSKLVLWSPVIAVVAFGLGCLAVLIYRVATFKDCPEAAEELQREIQDAKNDLKAKGIKL